MKEGKQNDNLVWLLSNYRAYPSPSHRLSLKKLERSLRSPWTLAWKYEYQVVQLHFDGLPSTSAWHSPKHTLSPSRHGCPLPRVDSSAMSLPCSLVKWPPNSRKPTVHSNLHEKTKQNRTRSKTTKTNPPSDLSIKTTYWRNLAVQLCDNFIKLVRVCPITVFEESKRADISRLEPSSVLVKLILGRSVKWS